MACPLLSSMRAMHVVCLVYRIARVYNRVPVYHMSGPKDKTKSGENKLRTSV